MRDQERQLDPIDRAGDRVRGEAPDRDAASTARRSVSRRGTGTRATAARTRCATRKKPTTTATSSSPTSYRSRPSPAWIDEVRAALPMLPAARRGAGWPRSPASGDERGRDVDRRARPGRLRAGGRRRRRRRRPHRRAPQGGVRRARRPSPICPPPTSPRSLGSRSAAAITATQAKSVLARMIENGGGNAAAIAAEMGFEAMDTSALEAIVDEAIAGQPDAWAKYLAGERKALGAIVGQVMKASKGQADGKLVNEIVDDGPDGRRLHAGGNRTSFRRVRFPLTNRLRSRASWSCARFDDARSRPLLPRRAEPRRPLRRLVLRGGPHDRHLLPAELPGGHAEAGQRRLLPVRRGRPAARVPGVQALPARRLARFAGVGRARRPRRAGDAADRRRRRRPRGRDRSRRAASATACATSTGS